MKQRSVRVWLVDIREQIAGIRDLTKDADLAAFAANRGMKRAVEHAIAEHLGALDNAAAALLESLGER
jgi:uncharacterized protein with HEPN domain